MQLKLFHTNQKLLIVNNSIIIIDCYYKQSMLFKHKIIFFLFNIADVEIV